MDFDLIIDLVNRAQRLGAHRAATAHSAAAVRCSAGVGRLSSRLFEACMRRSLLTLWKCRFARNRYASDPVRPLRAYTPLYEPRNGGWCTNKAFIMKAKIIKSGM